MRSSRALGILLVLAAVTGMAGPGGTLKNAGPAGLQEALEQLEREGKFSGAVVIRDANGVRFAEGFGLADPFTGRPFTPDTPVDSASLAKPVTAAAVLTLAGDGTLDLDAPVQRYLPRYPHAGTTGRHLLAHSAGLPADAAFKTLEGKTNAMLLAEVGQRRLPPLFAPGTGFAYCNLCYSTLALLVEQVSGKEYLQFAQERVALPAGVSIRPARLAEWNQRAIGYRRGAEGTFERADSYDDERFYGSANLSISAQQLAEWGAAWWKPALQPIREIATTPATIAGQASGLSWGSWHCAPGGRRCHYLGHHEGFHHLLYWDGNRELAIAMVSNNTLSPTLQQRLQRALVAFAEQRDGLAARELSKPLAGAALLPGTFRFPSGETVRVTPHDSRLTVERRGIRYSAFPVGSGIRYVPGLDSYLVGAEGGSLHWFGMHEDLVGVRMGRQK